MVSGPRRSPGSSPAHRRVSDLLSGAVMAGGSEVLIRHLPQFLASALRGPVDHRTLGWLCDGKSETFRPQTLYHSKSGVSRPILGLGRTTATDAGREDSRIHRGLRVPPISPKAAWSKRLPPQPQALKERPAVSRAPQPLVSAGSPPSRAIRLLHQAARPGLPACRESDNAVGTSGGCAPRNGAVTAPSGSSTPP